MNGMVWEAHCRRVKRGTCRRREGRRKRMKTAQSGREMADSIIFSFLGGQLINWKRITQRDEYLPEEWEEWMRYREVMTMERVVPEGQ